MALDPNFREIVEEAIQELRAKETNTALAHAGLTVVSTAFLRQSATLMERLLQMAVAQPGSTQP